MRTFPIMVETINAETDVRIDKFEADLQKYFEVNENQPLSKAKPFIERGAPWEGDHYAGTFKRIYVKSMNDIPSRYTNQQLYDWGLITQNELLILGRDFKEIEDMQMKR